MEFWKIIALSTWAIILILGVIFFYLRKKWLSFSKDVLLGRRLHFSIDQLFDEISNRKIQKETLAKVSKHTLWRLTRIGVFAIILGFTPILFLSIQTYLLKIQNDRIYLQNNLLEAQRRSSLIVLMSNIMDQMNEEINIYRRDTTNVFNDDVGSPLSKPLMGRISGLSEGFLPYQIYQDGILSEKEYSTERAQLLLSLINSGLQDRVLQYIYSSTTFRQSYLKRSNLKGVNLSGVNLSESDLSGADLSGANLSGAIIRDADLSGATLYRTNLNGADLSRSIIKNADLSGANFSEAIIKEADLSGAILNGAYLNKTNLSGINLSHAYLRGAYLNRVHLQKANLREADFYRAYLRGANLREANFYKSKLHDANLREANLKNIKNINSDQLITVFSLYQVQNINSKLEEKIKFQQKECRFTKEGCKYVSLPYRNLQ